MKEVALEEWESDTKRSALKAQTRFFIACGRAIEAVPRKCLAISAHGAKFVLHVPYML